jgi:hypothetical protein
MQTQTQPKAVARLMNVAGTQVVNSLRPNAEACFIDNKAAKLSVEYARARTAINEDYKLMFPRNQALAKRMRQESKKEVVSFLDGKVSKKWNDMEDTSKGYKLIVSFPDGSVANL